MSESRKVERLVDSCKLLDNKIKKAKYWTLNGKLNPVIKKQVLSIIKQANNINKDEI